jgi:hypothetical protein
MTQKEAAIKWEVIDSLTDSEPLMQTTQFRRALNRADKLDAEYGAHRYRVQRVNSEDNGFDVGAQNDSRFGSGE